MLTFQPPFQQVLKNSLKTCGEENQPLEILQNVIFPDLRCAAACFREIVQVSEYVEKIRGNLQQHCGDGTARGMNAIFSNEYSTQSAKKNKCGMPLRDCDTRQYTIIIYYIYYI